jgi:hypothetical protein
MRVAVLVALLGAPAVALLGCAPASGTHSSAAKSGAPLPPLPPPPSESASVVQASADAVDGSAADAGPAAAAAAAAKALKELPRGGRELFPTFRLVGFCGTPGAPALGELQGNLVTKGKALEAQAARYADKRQILPTFELIAVVVQGYPGPDGLYRRRVDNSVVDDYLKAARRAKGILLLNIQPGHSDFMTEVKTFEPYLHESDVGVALDPEWAMKPNQKPGVFYGQTTGEIIDSVAEYLSDIIQRDNLPEKPLVFHQVNDEVLKDEAALKAYPGVQIIKSVDGLGPQAAKMNTYHYLVKKLTPVVHPGFKLFFDEDTRNGSHLMSPKQVLSLTPTPEYVIYE